MEKDTFNAFSQIKSLMEEADRLTLQNIKEAGEFIKPISDLGASPKGVLSPDGTKLHALSLLQYQRMRVSMGVLDEASKLSNGNDSYGTKALVDKLMSDVTLLWDMVTYECDLRFQWQGLEGPEEVFPVIGPHYEIFFLSNSALEEQEEDEEIDLTHIPDPSGLPN